MGRVSVTETELIFRDPLTLREMTAAVVIHHTGAELDPDAKTIHDWHRQKGWSGCGYHYSIRKDGSIERGRPEWAIGSHAYGRNADTVGVHVAGEFTHTAPSKAQMESLVLLADLCDTYSLNPVLAIIGHRDTPRATECPGNVLYGTLPDIRNRVCELLTAGGQSV